MKNLSKFRGCLIGGAAGDALGYAVEFQSLDGIRRKFGEKGIQRYEKINGKAIISDDTQMTLFTANGILLGITRGKMRGIMGPLETYIYYSYLDWLYTQTSKSIEEYQYTWLRNVKRLHARRSPGATCLDALMSGMLGTIDDPINNSKGCGGVMRVAPVGLYLCDHRNENYVTELGAKVAAITHGHPLGFIPAAALVNIIYNCFSERFSSLEKLIKHSIEFTSDMFSKFDETKAFVNLMNKVIELSKSKNEDIKNILTLGEGWVADETLAIAVYCSLKYQNDFKKAVTASVNHGGDSDSTGAVTGNILGAWLGIEKIPQYFIDDLELIDVIEEIAKDLYNDCQMDEYSDYRDEVWADKYISMTYSM